LLLREEVPLETDIDPAVVVAETSGDPALVEKARIG
jgi:hypothetical protein